MTIFSKSSLIQYCFLAGATLLAGTAMAHAGTVSVVSFNENGPTSFMNSGVTQKTFWSLGSGGGNYSTRGNDAYSQQTGNVSPEQAGVLGELLKMFVVDENGNESAFPTYITGGQLVQVNENQEFVSELFAGNNQSGAASFGYSLPENAPYYVRSVSPVPRLPGGILYLTNGTNTGTITVTVPTTPPTLPPSSTVTTPEPAALSLMAIMGMGLLLMRRRRKDQ